jgi:serine/threonine protein kinase
LSQSSNVSGTFAYMPPEGFDGKRSVQTDVWSVGVNLYQFLSGTLPFPNKEPSALIAAIMMREFEPLPAAVPQNLQNVVAKALAKQPESRYASAAAMREDLRRVLRGEAVADFIQSDSRQTFTTEQITQQKSVPNFAQNFQDENETVVRSAPNFGQYEEQKNSKVLLYSVISLLLLSAIGLGIYFLTNQPKQIDSNKKELAKLPETKSSNLEKMENINSVINTNLPTPEATPSATPTPLPTPNLIGMVDNSGGRYAEGCGCYISSAKQSRNQQDYYYFLYDYEAAYMKIEGQVVKLSQLSTTEPKRELRKGDSFTEVYGGGGITAHVNYTVSGRGYEHTEYKITITVKKGNSSQTVTAIGSCGC